MEPSNAEYERYLRAYHGDCLITARFWCVIRGEGKNLWNRKSVLLLELTHRLKFDCNAKSKHELSASNVYCRVV